MNRYIPGLILLRITPVMKKKIYSNGYNNMSAKELIDFIQDKHHTYLKRVLPMLGLTIENLTRIDHAAEVDELSNCFHQLEAILLQHMMNEDETFFPSVRRLLLENRVQAMETSSQNHFNAFKNEYRQLDSLLNEIQQLTNNYTPPGDASPQLKLCYAQLFDLEQDLSKHFFLEEHYLQPRLMGSKQ